MRRRVQPLCDHLLPRSVLAGNEHVRVRGRHAGDDLEHCVHRARPRNECRDVRRQSTVLGRESLVRSPSTRELDLRPDDRDEALVVPRLLDVVGGPAPYGLDRALDASVGSHDDHRQRRVHPPETRQHIESFAPRRRVPCIVQVHQHGVERLSFHRLDDLDRPRGGDHAIALLLQQKAKGVQHRGLIVRDQYRWTGNAGRRGVRRHGWGS